MGGRKIPLRLPSLPAFPTTLGHNSKKHTLVTPPGRGGGVDSLE